MIHVNEAERRRGGADNEVEAGKTSEKIDTCSHGLWTSSALARARG